MLREGNTTAQHQSWDRSWDVGLQSSCSVSLPCCKVSWTSLCSKPFSCLTPLLPCPPLGMALHLLSAQSCWAHVLGWEVIKR